MIWEDWPQGAESIDASGDRELCPVCSSTLRPVEILSIIGDNTAFYVAICPKCRTQYLRDAPADTITISPDAETITELEERVRTLENTLARLIAWIRTQPQQQAQPKAIQERPTGAKPEQKSRTENDTPEDFTQKYRYLL